MKKGLLLITTGIILSACSNDSDYFPSFKNDCSWETSLSEIITDNQTVFSDRGIKITNMQFMKDISIDRDLFLGDKYGFFPVYSKLDSVFTVVTYGQLMRDSANYFFDTIPVFNTINDLLEEADDFDIVELTWQYDDNKYNSLAFFNKRTGELRYDNMLYNMSTLSHYKKESFSRALNNTEMINGVGDSGNDCVEYIQNNCVLARSGIEWEVKGKWRIVYQYHYSDDDSIYYNTSSTFAVDHVKFTRIRYVTDEVLYDTYYDKRDLSPGNTSTYKFRYAIWAGPKNGLNIYDGNNPFNMNLESPEGFANRIIAGCGRLVEQNSTVSPRYGQVAFPKPQNPND
jgi:hypothetical protein